MVDDKGRPIPAASDSHEVDLYVDYKPTVTELPKNTSVLENSGTAEMECLCESNVGLPSEIRYYWFLRLILLIG